MVVTDSRAPIRVCHLIHDLGPGGAEHVIVDLARAAAPAGLAISVVSMLPIEGLRYPERLRDLGVPVRALDLSAWWDPRGPRRLRRLLADLDPQILHSHLKHADVVAGRVARRVGIPHVSTLHVIEDTVGRIGRWKRNLAVASRRRTAAVTIAVSEAQRRWYLAVSGEDPSRVVTLYNGIPDPGAAAPATRTAVRADLGIADDEVAVAMVAIMRPGKGHDVALAAARSFVPPVRLVLAGDGDLMDEVARQAAPLGDRVLRLGFCEDVPRLLAGMDLVVHPTMADALPTALVHAVAAGLPVVASDVGGVPEIVVPGAGELVPPGDAAALAAAVNRLAADPGLRRQMGARGRERFVAAFDAATWVAALRDRYRGLLPDAS